MPKTESLQQETLKAIKQIDTAEYETTLLRYAHIKKN